VYVLLDPSGERQSPGCRIAYCPEQFSPWRWVFRITHGTTIKIRRLMAYIESSSECKCRPCKMPCSFMSCEILYGVVCISLIIVAILRWKVIKLGQFCAPSGNCHGPSTQHNLQPSTSVPRSHPHNSDRSAIPRARSVLEPHEQMFGLNWLQTSKCSIQFVNAQAIQFSAWATRYLPVSYKPRSTTLITNQQIQPI
jgi:hypothetical protein